MTGHDMIRVLRAARKLREGECGELGPRALLEEAYKVTFGGRPGEATANEMVEVLREAIKLSTEQFVQAIR